MTERRTIGIVIDPSAYFWLVSSFKANVPTREFDLTKIALLFDQIHYFGNPHGIEFIEDQPYGQFLDIANEIVPTLGRYLPVTDEQVSDTKIALGDPSDSEGGHMAYTMLRALLAFAKNNQLYYFSFSGHMEKLIQFCLKYEPDYLLLLKESFLLCRIQEYLFENEIPAFDPVRAKGQLNHFSEYKESFQNGIIEILNQLKGNYMLSDEHKTFIRQWIAKDEKRLLDFLKPENLRKFNTSETIRDFFLGLLPYPLDTMYDIAKEIKEIREFKKANLDFVLSLAILKQLSNIKDASVVSECAVCSLSFAEIDNMTEDECDEFITSSDYCTMHIVGLLDLRKRFGLYGKKLLQTIKELEDSSVHHPSPTENE